MSYFTNIITELINIAILKIKGAKLIIPRNLESPILINNKKYFLLFHLYVPSTKLKEFGSNIVINYKASLTKIAHELDITMKYTKYILRFIARKTK